MDYLKKKYEWALSRQATSLLQDLVDLGMDRDLAFSIMEANLPDQTLYALVDDEDDGAEDVK